MVHFVQPALRARNEISITFNATETHLCERCQFFGVCLTNRATKLARHVDSHASRKGTYYHLIVSFFQSPNQKSKEKCNRKSRSNNNNKNNKIHHRSHYSVQLKELVLFYYITDQSINKSNNNTNLEAR